MLNDEIRYIEHMFYQSRGFVEGIEGMLEDLNRRSLAMSDSESCGERGQAMSETIDRLDEMLSFMRDINMHCAEIIGTQRMARAYDLCA